jgi:hypothetical protein
MLLFLQESEMAMAQQASGPIEGLDLVLKVLDTVSVHSRGDEQQQLVEEAKRVVSKLRGTITMKRSQAQQVAELVRANNWSKANEAMKCTFPRGISIGFIEEVLALVCITDNLHDLTSAIMWAGFMNHEHIATSVVRGHLRAVQSQRLLWSTAGAAAALENQKSACRRAGRRPGSAGR